MTTTNEKTDDSDVMFLQAKIRGLENDVRQLRETLWDRYAMAAISGGAIPEVARDVADATLRQRAEALSKTR